MAIINIIGVQLDRMGELTFQAGSGSLDPATATWSTSADGGTTWQSFTYPEGGLRSTDADPTLLYRFQDMTQETYNPLYHERTFQFSREEDDVTAIVTLTRPETASQRPSETRMALDLNDSFSWTSATVKTYENSATDSIFGDNGFETFTSYSRNAEGGLTLTGSGTRDVLDQRDWTEKWSPAIQSYGDNEQHISYDDGRYRIEYELEDGSYPTELGSATGPVRIVRWEDAQDAYAWETRDHIYTEGRLVASYIGADDGVLKSILYLQEEDGTARIESQSTDNDNIYAWESVSTGRIDGQLMYSQRQFDDGSNEYRQYEYDESGLIRVMSEDRDGTIRETGYQDGARVGYFYQDVNDAFAWSTQTMQVEGTSEVREVIYDDGVVRQTELEDGQLVFVHIEDTADAHSYAHIDTFYDAGQRVETVNVSDRGAETYTTYGTNSEGASIVTGRSSFVLEGMEDNFVWSEITTEFDEAGQKAARMTEYADGRMREETFSEGALATRVTTDWADAYRWHEINEVWEDGTRISRDVTYDDALM